MFDSINLPAADAAKPADLPADQEDQKDQADIATDTKPTEDDASAKPNNEVDAKPSGDGAAEDDNKQDDQPAKEAEDKGEEDKPEDKADLTPFHQHPDWKKMQDRLEAAEKRAEEAERAASEAKTAATANPEYEGLSPAQIATKEVEKKAAAGWKPKDQLEVNQVYAEELEKAKEIKARQDQQKQEDTTRAAERAVSGKFLELGISDATEQQKVKDLVLNWSKNGVNISLATFDIAAEQLKLKGEIGRPKVPTQTEESKQKEAAAKKARDDANRKVSKNKPDGEGAKNTKPNYDFLHKNDLDTIVQDLGKSLG